MQKYICFRFDVDTHLCLSKGVPNLMLLANKYQAEFTFFINMGRAFDRRLLIKEKYAAFFNKQPKPHGFFPMFYKLGFMHSIYAMGCNPIVGAKHKKILHQLTVAGHELGLHGGKNHADWEKNAKNWSSESIFQEISYGLDHLKRHSFPNPVSFASPCWQSPEELPDIILKNGFSILCDEYADGDFSKDKAGLSRFHVNIIGKQGNIGFIENMRALEYTTEQIMESFEKQLNMPGNFKMVFDHPLYAGIRELPLLSQMLEMCISKGYKIKSLRNINTALFE